ncbi:MAG: glutaredoxin family protein [Acidobacteria bacterium]|nr:glutaredoxin family protein [Acidobacteriota bacterium]
MTEGPTDASHTQHQPEVVLYTRQGCHLCDDAKRVLRELQTKERFEFQEIDIDRDPLLQQRYNDEVPVIFIYGKKAFKYRIDSTHFLKRLKAGRS